MMTTKSNSTSLVFLCGIALFLMAELPKAQATPPTFWTGPSTNYSQAINTSNPDSIVAGVSLKRQYQELLYNPAAGEGSATASSPADTEWATATNATVNAVADLTQATNLSYVNFATWASGPPYTGSGSHTFNRILNYPAVLHLKNENIYISIKFTYWGSQNQGFTASVVSYTRSTPAVSAPAPTIGITNPASGAVFVAPATVSIVTTNSGSITNVQFFTNSVLLGTVLTAPFNLTNTLPAGAYALKAVATAAGISATSAVVNITVDAPPAVTITNPSSGAVFSAPANITIRASASDADGTVTNVQFLVGPNVLTNISSGTYSGTTNNLAAGGYTLTAIASDNFGVKNTNSISINVVTPVATTLSGVSASAASTNFQFSYLANVGLSYVVQRSTNLTSTNWLTIFTNTAASSTVIFMDNNATNSAGFYRVGRLPNP